MDEDILTGLPIRTQTGPLSIPVECTARRVKPKLSTTLVVFQGTIMGESEVQLVQHCAGGMDLQSDFHRCPFMLPHSSLKLPPPRIILPPLNADKISKLHVRKLSPD